MKNIIIISNFLSNPNINIKVYNKYIYFVICISFEIRILMSRDLTLLTKKKYFQSLASGLHMERGFGFS